LRTGFTKKSDKSELFGVFCGELDTAPLIKECPVCMSCSLYEAVKLPSDVLYIGEPKEVFTEVRFMTDNQLDIKRAKGEAWPLVRIFPTAYQLRAGIRDTPWRPFLS